MTTKRSWTATWKNLVVSSGKKEIDDRLGGGIPQGSVALIEGQSDAGKSVLAQQICYGALGQGLAVSYYTTENTMQSLIRHMDSLGFLVMDYFLLGMLRIIPLRIPNLSGAKEMGSLFKNLAHHTGNQKSEVVIIDSLTNLVMFGQFEEITGFVSVCKSMCDLGKTVIMTVHPHAFEEENLIRMRSLCDVHLQLHVEEVGASLRKSLHVSKIRGAAKTAGNIVSFEVEPNLGMRVFPIAQALA